MNATSDADKKIGVHSLDHFALQIPDLAEGALFYERFGLTVTSGGSEFGIAAMETPHRWARIMAGPKKQLRYLSFGAYAEDMPVFTERIKRRGIARLAPPPDAVDDSGIWFRDEDNTLIEIRVAEKVSPNAKSLVSNPTVSRRSGGDAAALGRSVRAATTPFARARLYKRCRTRDRVLSRYGRLRTFGCCRRRDRVHARHSRQRSSSGCLCKIRCVRLSPLQLGCRIGK